MPIKSSIVEHAEQFNFISNGLNTKEFFKIKIHKGIRVFMFNSTWECNPLVLREAISYGCKILARNLPQYCGMFDEYITPIDENNLKAQLKEALDGYIDYEIPTYSSSTSQS